MLFVAVSWLWNDLILVFFILNQLTLRTRHLWINLKPGRIAQVAKIRKKLSFSLLTPLSSSPLWILWLRMKNEFSPDGIRRCPNRTVCHIFTFLNSLLGDRISKTSIFKAKIFQMIITWYIHFFWKTVW